MEILEKNISEIRPYQKNPRKNDNAVEPVMKSIQEFGFKVPIVIDADCVIVAGHTRYQAAKKLNLQTVPCIVADDLTKKQIKAFRIADNKTSDFSIWDNKLLLEELSDLEDIFTGFEFGLDHIMESDVLYESDNSFIEDNETGVIYEAVFKSEDKSKIEKIQELWNEIKDGET